jgi:hypothetical protein
MTIEAFDGRIVLDGRLERDFDGGIAFSGSTLPTCILESR